MLLCYNLVIIIVSMWGEGDVPKFGVYFCHPISRIFGPFIEHQGLYLGGFSKITDPRILRVIRPPTNRRVMPCKDSYSPRNVQWNQ